MPARNVIKHYLPENYYHIYNRGFDKRNIFLDADDYSTFIYLLKRSLDPNTKKNINGFMNRHNISADIEMISYCLMPNHFHFLLKIHKKEAITKLLKIVFASYVLYFNKKYDKSGTLLQGKPRGVLIDNESYLLHLTRYIHANPSDIVGFNNLKLYKYSSYQEYLNLRKSKWVKPDDILVFFKSAQKSSFKDKDMLSYESFVEGYKASSSSLPKNLTLDL